MATKTSSSFSSSPPPHVVTDDDDDDDDDDDNEEHFRYPKNETKNSSLGAALAASKRTTATATTTKPTTTTTTTTTTTKKKWVMCSAAEARDREIHAEISEFEATAATVRGPPNRRVADPCLCVKKYRRSAAGGGVVADDDDGGRPRRSPSDLDATVTHLLRTVLCRRSDDDDDDVVAPLSRSLTRTSVFVDDRLRAAQVDHVRSFASGDAPSTSDLFVTLRHQLRTLRYNLWIGYLLNDGSSSSSSFEHKFNAHAVQTSFASCLATARSAWSRLDEDENDDDDDGATRADRRALVVRALDEVSSLSVLLRVCADLLRREPSADALALCGRTALLRDGSSTAETLADVASSSSYRRSFPRGERAREVAAAADAGNHVRLLRLLRDDDDDVADASWFRAARCVVAPALPVIRLNALRRYNKSLGKAERVSGTDLARLLRVGSPERALEFCARAGLPRDEKDGARIVFKVAPLCVGNGDGPETLLFQGRADDDFVFGTTDDDWKTGGRTDEDGVVVPSGRVLWSLIR